MNRRQWKKEAKAMKQIAICYRNCFIEEQKEVERLNSVIATALKIANLNVQDG